MAKEPDIDEFVGLISSSKTKKIYKEPIVFNSGEIEEFEEYLQGDGKDPYYTVVRLKTFINSFLDEYPEYKPRQYTNTNKFQKTHKYNQKIINNIISSGKMQLLTQYDQFELTLFDRNQLVSIFQNATEDTLKYFVDNITGNIHEKFDGKWHLINYICSQCGSYKKFAFIKYFIEKYGGMQYPCPYDGWHPLHQIIHHTKNNELIKFGIDKHIESGKDLHCQNDEGKTILSFIVRYCAYETINYALSKVDKTNQEFKKDYSYLHSLLEDSDKITDGERTTLMHTLDLLIEN